MDTRFLFLGASAVIGAGYIAQSATKCGMEKLEEKLEMKNEALKTWIARVAMVAGGALAIYAVCKQYNKIVLQEKTIAILKNQIADLKLQLNDFHHSLLLQFQTQLFNLMENVQQQMDLTPMFEKMMEKAGRLRFQEILTEVGVFERATIYNVAKKINIVTNAFYLSGDYAIIPALKNAVEKLSLVQAS